MKQIITIYAFFPQKEQQLRKRQTLHEIFKMPAKILLILIPQLFNNSGSLLQSKNAHLQFLHLYKA